MWCSITTYSHYAAVLSRITGLDRPSFCPSLGPEWAPNSRTKSRKYKLCVNVFKDMSITSVPIFSSKLKIEVTGRHEPSETDN